MKRWTCIGLLFLVLLLGSARKADAQCSICSRTAQQMGERPAKALNAGIIYLAIMPFLIFGFIGYRWYRSNREAT
jgi:hypothetical protein